MKALDTMQDITLAWDNGATLPWDLPGNIDEQIAAKLQFRARTGAERAVELRWRCNGRPVCAPYPCDLLPDRSGIATIERVGGDANGARFVRVTNADGSHRFDFRAPIVDERSIPEQCNIVRLMPVSMWNMPLAVIAYDGARDLALDVDWSTGAVLRWMSGGGLDRW
jgi:hypothetical protein